MSTHGCLAPPFPPFYIRLLRLDVGVQEPDATIDDDYYSGGAYYYVYPLMTTKSSLGGSQAGGLRLFRSVSQFVLAFLRQTCLTYVCTQILLLPLTRL